MTQLMVSATALEIQPVLDAWGHHVNVTTAPIFIHGVHTDILITGVGTPAMIYHLTKCLQHQSYNHVVLVGIAGCLQKDIELGRLFEVTCNQFIDLGAESANGFIDVFELDLLDNNQYPYSDKCLQNSSLPKWNLDLAHAISKNTVTGNLTSINQLDSQNEILLESMEGAAFFYTCALEKAVYSEIRSISNHIEVRDKSKWDIQLAIKNLSNFILNQFKK